jgi:tol-pal system protein YbgF
MSMARMIFRASAQSLLGLAAVAALVVAPVARAQEGEHGLGLFDRIFGGSERLSGGSAAERGGPPGPDRTGTVPLSGVDLSVRVDRLEAQIRQLTGVIEQLQYRNQQLEALLRRMQEEGAPRPGQPRPQVAPMTPVPAAPAAPGRRGDAFDPALHPGAPGSPHVLGTVATAGAPTAVGAPDPPIGAPGGRGAGSPLDLATMPPSGPPPPLPPRGPQPGTLATTAPPSQTPRDEFDLAYGYILHRDYALAEDSFRNFLSKYPSDRLAGDATFWFGESLFQRQRFRDAAEAFLNVSTKFESNPRAPDALLRLGQSLAALGEKEAACASLGEVLRKFPRASAGVKQGVEREQKRVHC